VSIGTAIVATIAILAFMVMRIVRYQTDHRRHTIAPPPDDGEKAMLRREVEDLRERVKVLERITTDTNTTAALETRRVADEIEALRDREHS
jgi:ATP-dependent protease ClpP protease subunit